MSDREFKIRLRIYRISPIILGVIIIYYLFTSVAYSDGLIIKSIQYYGILVIYSFCSARLARNLIDKHTSEYDGQEETKEA